MTTSGRAMWLNPSPKPKTSPPPRISGMNRGCRLIAPPQRGDGVRSHDRDEEEGRYADQRRARDRSDAADPVARGTPLPDAGTDSDEDSADEQPPSGYLGGPAAARDRPRVALVDHRVDRGTADDPDGEHDAPVTGREVLCESGLPGNVREGRLQERARARRDPRAEVYQDGPEADEQPADRVPGDPVREQRVDGLGPSRSAKMASITAGHPRWWRASGSVADREVRSRSDQSSLVSASWLAAQLFGPSSRVNASSSSTFCPRFVAMMSS